MYGFLHNEELHNLHFSNIIRVMKSRRMRWMGLGLHMRGDEKFIQNYLENLKGEDHLGDLSIYGRIILKWVLKK
jgi:hypothetical protein